MHTQQTPRRWIRPVLLFALLLIAAPAFGQDNRSFTIGSLNFGTNEALSDDNVNWPVDEAWIGQPMLQNHGVIVGVNRPWTDPSGNDWAVQVAQVAQNKFSDIQNVTVPVKDAFKRTFRNPPPQMVLDDQDWTPFFEREDRDPVDPNAPADVVVYSKVQGWPSYDMGIQIERWVYAFADTLDDDYLIEEWVVTNTSSEPRNDVYIGLTAETSSEDQYPADLWSDYDPAARMYYTWDANEPVEGYDTRGKPESKYGVLQEPQYFGYRVLHVDRSATDESDDPAQPHKAGWSQREKSPDLNISNQQGVYDFMADAWFDNPGDGQYAEYDPTGFYRTLIDGVDLRELDPVTEQEKTGFFSFGPYDLGPGEDVRIVTAFAGGVIPSRLAIDAGRAYENGQPGQLDLVPLPAGLTYGPLADDGQPIVRDGSVYDLDGNLIAEAGTTLSMEQKDAVIDIGKGLLYRTADRALEVWNNSDVAGGQGTFDVQYAPAAPSLQGFSEGDRIRLEWADNTTAGSRGGAPVAWRIYRGYKRPPALSTPTDTLFVLLKEVPASQTEYIDEGVVRGEEYYYYVTAVNAEGVESSPLQNRTGTSATRSDQALIPRQPAMEEGWQDQVVVVPNPYHVQSTRKYSGRRLNFLNLPAYARIHIYTMMGDEIQAIEHNADAGDEDWDRQDTFSTMEIVSGVYLYVVEKLDGPNGSPTGETAIGKFVVIK
ncbi:MAG TPA: hypothetical protein VFG50_02670 [Rhodothermales bacterium]|nr:hypothetical protein [Rhodothermales bacterium]